MTIKMFADMVQEKFDKKTNNCFTLEFTRNVHKQLLKDSIAEVAMQEPRLREAFKSEISEYIKRQK